MKNIAIFFGGQSPEHEVSILTGVQAYHAFDTHVYKPIAVYVSREGQLYTGTHLAETKEYKNTESLLDKSELVQIKKASDGVYLTSKKTFGGREIKIDCAFLAFHGGTGENGGFQGLCETLDLPYTGSDVLGSSLCMDKVIMKKILSEGSIPNSEYMVALEKDFSKDTKKLVTEIESELSYPLFIKPSNGGSSIGVSRAKNQQELENALELAFSFDAKVLIEKEFEHDTEINISCFGLWNKEVRLSVAEEVYSDSEFLDFENKYLKGSKSKKTVTPSGSKGMASTQRKIPAQISTSLQARIEECARKAFIVLNCGGVARIDFLVDKKTDSFVLVEVNSIPGSLAFYLWEATGVPFTSLVHEMVNLAFERHEDKRKHTRTFTSNIFKNL